MLKTNFPKRSWPYRIWLIPLLGLFYSCTFSTWRLQIFSPNSQNTEISDKIWYSEVHGGAAKSSPNDMLSLKLRGSKTINALLLAKPTLHQRSTEGFLFIPLIPGSLFSPTKLYTPEDPNLQIGLVYDDLKISPGEDCFKIKYADKIIKGEVKHSSVAYRRDLHLNRRIFPNHEPEKDQNYGLFEIRFPVDPYSVQNFELLSCTFLLEKEPIIFPQIEFKKDWQDRSWAGP